MLLLIDVVVASELLIVVSVDIFVIILTTWLAEICWC